MTPAQRDIVERRPRDNEPARGYDRDRAGYDSHYRPPVHSYDLSGVKAAELTAKALTVPLD